MHAIAKKKGRVVSNLKAYDNAVIYSLVLSYT